MFVRGVLASLAFLQVSALGAFTPEQAFIHSVSCGLSNFQNAAGNRQICPSSLRLGSPLRAGLGSGSAMMSARGVTVDEAKAATFEQAQKLGMSLGTSISSRLQRGEPADNVEQEALLALLSHSDGARGFYVTTLTAPELKNMFQEPIDPSITEAIKASPDPNAKLLAMNIAMSTATELAHLANGNSEYAKGSALTRDRTRTLISTLAPSFPALQQHVTDLFSAATTPVANPPTENAEVESYRAFLTRWGYDEKMREAIAAQLRPFV